MTVVEAIEGVKNSVIQKKSHNFPIAASIGDSFRQGDIYITKCESVPSAYSKIKPVVQLAPGNTQGSRHCLENLSGVEMYRNENPSLLEGPVIVLNCEKTITHPEHGHVTLPPGVYSITYQRNLDEMERIQRVRD